MCQAGSRRATIRQLVEGSPILRPVDHAAAAGPRRRDTRNLGHVRVQGGRRRRRHDGRRDRPGDRRRRHPGRAQGRRAAVRRPGAREGALAVAGRASTPASSRPAERDRSLSADHAPATDYERLRRRRLRDRGGARADRAQAGGASPSSTRSRRATRSSPRTPPRCRSPRSARRRAAPTRWSASTSSIPASVMRLIEVIEGEDTSPETVQVAFNFAQAIRKTADPLRRGARVRRQPDPQLERLRALARAGGDRCRRRGDRPDRRESKAAPMGPFFLARPARARHRAARRRAPARRPTATASSCTSGCSELVADGDLGAKTGRGLL